MTGADPVQARDPTPAGDSDPTGTRKPAAHRAPMAIRWVLVVYLPIVLALGGLGLLAAGAMPAWAVPPFAASVIWSALSMRLLSIRARVRGRTGPLRELLLTGFVALVSVVSGFILLSAGLGRVATGVGPVLMYSGIFLLALSIAAPAFKAADWALRGLLGRVRPASAPGNRPAGGRGGRRRGEARPARPESSRRAAGPAGKPAGAGSHAASGLIVDNESLGLFPPEVRPAAGYHPSESHQGQRR